jgi:hypothetical protein
MDVLPYAKAVYNENWLENDWYLNLAIPYRFLFSYIVGFFADTFGIIQTIIYGRLASYLLIVFSIFSLLKPLKTLFESFLYFFSIVLFFKFFPVGNGAGEWMLGGLETKVFAYAFAIMSLASFLSKKYQKGLFFSGLALSFHLLVGIYNLFCLLPIFLFYQRETNGFFKKIFKALPIFLLAGAIGIYGIVYQFFLIEEDVSKLGWDIYVNIRVPHHTLPNQFPFETWIKTGVFTLLNITFFLKSKQRKVKLMSAYALFSVIISLAGVLLFIALGASHHLKYYFFRFSDSMLPFLTLLNIAAFIIENKEKLYSKKEKQLKYVVLIACLFFIIPKTKRFLSKIVTTTSISKIKAATNKDIPMTEWIKKNTEKTSIFITPPDAQYFYINAERSIFVSWKHSPQNANDMVAWYNRLKLLNCGKEFKNLREVRNHYYTLTEANISVITEKYSDIDYFLTTNERLNFPILFKSSTHTLYKVRNMAKT